MTGRSSPTLSAAGQQERLFQIWIREFEKIRPEVLAGLAVLFTCLVGITTYVLGTQLSFSLLYLVPILLVTWRSGFLSGALISLLATAIWLEVDLESGITYELEITPYWNNLMRLGTFFVAVGLVAAMRQINSELEHRVRERTAALEAEMAERRSLESSIIEISDLERSSIGQDIHDELCQQLVGTAFAVNLLREKLNDEDSKGLRDAERIADLIDTSITVARNVARGLFPASLEAEGIEMAIRELASAMNHRFGIECTVRADDILPPSPPATSMQVYRIVQEAITNAAKHSGSAQVTVDLDDRAGKLRVTVTDYGVGIGGRPSGGEGMGLRIMAYRARLIQADLSVENSAEGGVRVSCQLT